MITLEDHLGNKKLIYDQTVDRLLEDLKSAHKYRKTFSCLVPFDREVEGFLLSNIQQPFIYLSIVCDATYAVPIWIHSIDTEQSLMSVVADIENFKEIKNEGGQIRLL